MNARQRSLVSLVLALPLLLVSCREPAAPPTPEPAPIPVPEVTASYSDLGFNNNVYYLGEDTFTGRALQDYEGGQRKMEYDFKDGILDGVVREWNEDGTQTTETFFVKGKRHGKNTYWNADGTLQKVQQWEHGELVSEEKFK